MHGMPGTTPLLLCKTQFLTSCTWSQRSNWVARDTSPRR